MQNIAFEKWFQELCQIATDNGHAALIDRSEPLVYRDYFDDDDTPLHAYVCEMKHFDAQKEGKSKW